MDCDFLKKYTVKITYKNQGSGIVVLASQSSKYSYILTAKHIFKEDGTLISKADLILKDIIIEYQEFDDDPFKLIECKDIYYTQEHDLAILMVEENSIKNIIPNILRLEILNIPSFEECFFKGYPKSSKPSSRCLESEQIETAERTTFRVYVNSILSSFNHDEFENTMGFSGSGVVTSLNDDFFLVGLVLEVEQAFNALSCLDFRKVFQEVNNCLKKNNYTLITINHQEDIERYSLLERISIKFLSIFKSSSQDKSIRRDDDNYDVDWHSDTPYSDDTKERNREIRILLEKGEVEKAKFAIEQIENMDEETYILKALIALSLKDIENAHKFIKKAEEIDSWSENIHFTQGVIYYFSTILENGFNGINPYPVDKRFIKDDKKNIEKSQLIFEEFSSENDNQEYDTWYLASLQLSDLEKAKRKAEEFLQKNPNHDGAIIYTVTYNFNINLSNSIDYLEELLSYQKDEVESKKIISLFYCYIHSKKYKDAYELLDNHYYLFENSNLLEDSYLIINKFNEFFKMIDISKSKNLQNLKELITIKELYYKKDWDKLIKVYEKQNTNLSKFHIYKIKALQNNWKAIVPDIYELLLVEDIPKKSLIDLAITATYNIRDYKKTVELFKEYDFELTDRLKRIYNKSITQLGEGNETDSRT